MSETPPDAKPAFPDRMCIDPKSPHYNQAVLQFEVGILFNGAEKTNIEEYCISEGWVRMPTGGKSKDRYGNPMTIKVRGTVKPYYKTA